VRTTRRPAQAQSTASRTGSWASATRPRHASAASPPCPPARSCGHRDTDGTYWLGRIAGPLRPADQAAREAAGLTHVRAADWLERPFGEHDVPAGVAATFARGGRNFQRTHGDAVERRTAELWADVTPPG